MKTKTNKTKATKVAERTLLSVSENAYKTVSKAVKKYASRKSGVVGKSSAELSEITGLSYRTITRGINNMIVNNELTREGTTRLPIYTVIK